MIRTYPGPEQRPDEDPREEMHVTLIKDRIVLGLVVQEFPWTCAARRGSDTPRRALARYRVGNSRACPCNRKPDDLRPKHGCRSHTGHAARERSYWVPMREERSCRRTPHRPGTWGRASVRSQPCRRQRAVPTP